MAWSDNRALIQRAIVDGQLSTPVAYRPVGGGPEVTIRGAFTDEPQIVNFGDAGVRTSRPRLFVVLADLAAHAITPAAGDECDVDGTTYTVESPVPDNEGASELLLEVAP